VVTTVRRVDPGALVPEIGETVKGLERVLAEA
jgi:hypothetical protein